jgi:hypothetical protein
MTPQRQPGPHENGVESASAGAALLQWIEAVLSLVRCVRSAAESGPDSRRTRTLSPPIPGSTKGCLLMIPPALPRRAARLFWRR